MCHRGPPVLVALAQGLDRGALPSHRYLLIWAVGCLGGARPCPWVTDFWLCEYASFACALQNKNHIPHAMF